MTQLHIFTDGGSRGNPGPAAYGFVIRNGTTFAYEEGETLGITTNNVAEYTAIIRALHYVRTHREAIGSFVEILVRMDSLLACQQLRNIFRVKQPHLYSLFEAVREEERLLAVSIHYMHIPREQNKEADAMVNAALDRKI